MIEVRIGISDSPTELHIESDLTQAQVIDAVKSALDKGETLSLTDIKGRQTLVPHGRISFVDVGAGTERRVGFATS
jgi:hypothetical protein